MMKIKLILFISLIITLSSCVFDITDNRDIKVYNNSKSDIYTFYSPCELNNTLIDERQKGYVISVEPDSIGSEDIVRPSWEEYIKECDNNKIRLYIIKKDSVGKYGWETVCQKNIYNKKYVLTIEDLEELNWQIEYN